MKFTTVLVTQPSRTGYLEESLKHLRIALDLNSNMDLLVIFNGESERGESILKPLIQSHSERVRFKVIKENSPLPGRFLSIIRKEGLRWVHFPGDDDLVIPESYASFSKTLEAHPDSIAIAFSAHTIDAAGLRTEKVLRPLNMNKISKSVALANALHKPPFVWPSLMFDFDALPRGVFASRFVFDWWVGINLLLAGEIQVVQVPLIQYRIHPAQESFRTSENRKRFEAEMMLHVTLFQENGWRTLHEKTDRKQFLAELEKKPPIYGDPTFGASILLMLQNTLGEDKPVSAGHQQDYWGTFAERHGVLLNLREFPGITLQERGVPDKFNFRLEIVEGTCPSVRKALHRLLSSSGDALGSIACAHSIVGEVSQVSMIQVDCGSLQIGSNASSLEGLLFRQIESHLDLLKVVGYQAAYWEIAVIQNLRRILQIVRKIRSSFLISWKR